MRILGKSIIFVLIAFILVLVVNNYGFTPLGDAVHPEMKRVFEAHPVEESYHYIAWLYWIPNLIFAQCQITLGRRNA
jgi:hypothetical protein